MASKTELEQKVVELEQAIEFLKSNPDSERDSLKKELDLSREEVSVLKEQVAKLSADLAAHHSAPDQESEGAPDQLIILDRNVRQVAHVGILRDVIHLVRQRYADENATVIVLAD